MKKIKIFSVILLIISTAVFAGCNIYENIMTDHTAPDITGMEDIQISVEDPEDTLLQGMSAEDDRDGDVTDALVVQDISEFDSEGNRTVQYAAVDNSGNVAYASRTMSYSDYSAPVFSLSAPLRFPMGAEFNICSGISASSTLDGDLTNNIKYTIDRTVSSAVTGTYQVEFRVMDSTGTTSYLATELEVYDPSEERVEVSLSSYLVYLHVGDSFNASSYYEGTDLDGDVAVDLNVDSNVDTSAAGTYYADYTVSTENGLSGTSRLVVVVS